MIDADVVLEFKFQGTRSRHFTELKQAVTKWDEGKLGFL